MAVSTFIFARNNGPIYDSLLKFVGDVRPLELSKYRSGERLSNAEFRRFQRAVNDWIDANDIYD